tara:strand:- start:249 stop:935 length:687 start_codon:yes stop_codon:yes gene_type:complete
MTGKQMLTLLSQKVEDEGNTLLTTDEKTLAINHAQVKVASLVDKSYLHPLEMLLSSVAVSSGSVNLNSIGILDNMLHRKIELIKISNTASEDAYIHMIDFEEIHKLQNKYYEDTNMDSTYNYAGHGYIWGNVLYIKPSSVSSVDIYYYKKPTDFEITVSSRATISLASECELDAILHEPIIDMAASEIFFRDNKDSRARASFENAIAIINVANQRELDVIEKGTGLKA